MIRKFSLITAASALAVGAVLALAGCGSSTPSSASTPKATSSAPARQGGFGGGAGGAAGGGTSGQIAAVNGQTLQVQDNSSQTAVTYSSSTTISKTASVALSDVTVGSCVTAVSAPSSSSSSASAAATTVAISQPVNGSCSTGFGRASGARPSGAPTARPSFRPTNRPSNRPSGGFGGGSFTAPTTGQVTAVSGTTITVDALDFQTQKTASKTVTVDSSTKYTEEQAATASAITVGECVTARGQADDTGTVAATALTVSDPVNGSCSTGFGFGQRGSGGGTGTQSGTTNG